MGTFHEILLSEGVFVAVDSRIQISRKNKMPGKCDKCSQEISGKTVTFQEKPFHPECFVCTQCRQELKGSIRQHEGDNYCEPCFGKHHAKRCGKCGKALTETGVKFVVYNEQSYHAECFTCIRCNETLSGKKFYNDPWEDMRALSLVGVQLRRFEFLCIMY